MCLSSLTMVVAWLAVASPDVLERYAREARAARQQVEAAQSGEFYLVADIPRARLRLKLRGLELRAFVLTAADVGGLLGVGVRSDWAESVYDFVGPEVLARREIRPESVEEEAAALNLTEQQGPSLPPSFRITCRPPLSVRFAPESSRGLWSFLVDRLRGPGEPLHQIRARLSLPEADYRNLFHCIPPKGKLIVILPSGGS